MEVNVGDKEIISASSYWESEQLIIKEKIDLKEACRKTFWFGYFNNFDITIKEEKNKVCREYDINIDDIKSELLLHKWDKDWLKLKYVKVDKTPQYEKLRKHKI